MADSKPPTMDPHAVRTAESQYASRGVWLVKVPKYMADKMKSADGPVGKIKTHIPSGGGKPEVLFCLNESLNKDPADTTPTTHKFITSAGFKQNLMLLTESDTGRLVLEGKVMQRMECRPHSDANYMQYSKQRIKQSNEPVRSVMQLKEPVNAYKPIANHAHLAEYEAKKKAEGKRARDDPEVVKEMLFKAFEKHQYYSLRDLERLTNQPVTHLKEILKEICKYNMKAPHRNMYELKQEFRHYDDS